MLQVAHLQPILKSDNGNFPLISCPKTKVTMGAKMMQVKEPGSNTFPGSGYISPQCGLKGLFQRSRIPGFGVVIGVTLVRKSHLHKKVTGS